MKDAGNNQQQCNVLLDRWAIAGSGSIKPPKEIPGFQMLKDFQPRTQGKLRTYDRVRTFRATSSSAELSLQYQPVMPWLEPWKFTLIGDDRSGITYEEAEAVMAQLSNHKITLAELAFDFPEPSKVNRRVVLRHARFGKSQRRKDRGGPGAIRYGLRQSPKMVRCYFKSKLGCYRIELEVHSPLLRKFGIIKFFQLGLLAAKLVPAHFQFVGIDWDAVRRYLIRRFGKSEANRISERARSLSASSLSEAVAYLKRRGIPNTHRFLRPLKINRAVGEAIRRWARAFPVDEETLLTGK